MFMAAVDQTLLATATPAIAATLGGPRERARFQGYFATVFTAASIGGPVLGGIVVSHVSWRWLFFANLPLAVFAARRLARLPKGIHHERPEAKSDVPGHILFAIGAV